MSSLLQLAGLGKAYREWGGELRRIASWFAPGVAPRDVGFSVASGETVGIIGQNGAGKSTLLKLITGTTRASEGSVQRCGRHPGTGHGFQCRLKRARTPFIRPV